MPKFTNSTIAVSNNHRLKFLCWYQETHLLGRGYNMGTIALVPSYPLGYTANTCKCCHLQISATGAYFRTTYVNDDHESVGVVQG